MSFHLEHSARHSSTTSGNPSSPPCFPTPDRGGYIYSGNGNLATGDVRNWHEQSSSKPSGRAYPSCRPLGGGSILIKKNGLFCHDYYAAVGDPRDGPRSALGRSCLPSMASRSNDDSRSLHVPPNVFCNFTGGLRIACRGEVKCCRIEDNLWDMYSLRNCNG